MINHDLSPEAVNAMARVDLANATEEPASPIGPGLLSTRRERRWGGSRACRAEMLRIDRFTTGEAPVHPEGPAGAGHRR